MSAAATEVLRVLAKNLESSGFDCQITPPCTSGSGSTTGEEIIVTSPVAPSRGVVRISDTGSITWERAGSLDEDGLARTAADAVSCLRAEYDPQFLTVAEVAGLLRVSEMTVHRMIREGYIKAPQLGPRVVRIPAGEVRRLATEGSPPNAGDDQ